MRSSSTEMEWEEVHSHGSLTTVARGPGLCYVLFPDLKPFHGFIVIADTGRGKLFPAGRRVVAAKVRG
jgi:hypothetical protein